TTGRTEGTVLLTNLTIPIGGRRLLQNQVLATYFSAPGDSGSPVISAQGPDSQDGIPIDTLLLGIAWGVLPSRELGILGLFSPIGGVQADLGPLDFFAFGSVDVATGGIAPGGFVDLGPIPLPPSCVGDCVFRITVDSHNSVDEGSNGEVNN